ncbi:MAG: hypothetical protein Q7T66_03695 [Herminiimonas sp.]|uniref:hypothetical protein n=1 Tax=Herminiimonas sp. TaxID=1926289 RepID=UPI0027270D52|nr:hypothetical protein [Herminiimonas sp.]MDO9419747.1 hypothetical protein [Herminiimonas sp.]
MTAGRLGAALCLFYHQVSMAPLGKGWRRAAHENPSEKTYQSAIDKIRPIANPAWKIE